MTPTTSRVTPWAGLVGRVLLAGVLGYAALTKIGDPAATVRAVRAYRILPELVVVPFAHALPPIELAVAVLLLTGIALRFAAALSAGLLAMFVIGIASAWARGLKIDCGCFGGGGPTANPAYLGELLRDGLLLAVAVVVGLIGHSAWSVQARQVDLPKEPRGATRAQLRHHRAALGQAIAARRRAELLGTGQRVGAVTVVVVAALAGIVLNRAPSGPFAVPTGVTASGGVLVGRATAPRHLILFEDPQCPVCGEFEKTSGAILQRAITKGTVQVEYRMRSFLGPESVRADAALAAAAQEGTFEPLRKQLFAHQPQEHTGGYQLSTLLSLGQAVGLTDSAYRTSVTRQTFAPWVRWVDDQASRDGNVGTPELRLDGQALSPQTVFTPALLAAALGVA
jgi:protein-disulfide isomerase